MLFWLLAFGVLALAAYNFARFLAAKGSIADRLAACWQGSLTIFVGVWGGIVSIAIVALDGLAQVTGDPQFAQLADAVKGVIPAQYHPWIPVAALTAATLARLRTAGTPK